MRCKIRRRQGRWLFWCDQCVRAQSWAPETLLAAVHDEVMRHVRGHRIFADLERLGG